jgi:hypothetical protein
MNYQIWIRRKSQLLRRLKPRSPEIKNASRIASRDTGSQALQEYLNHFTPFYLRNKSFLIVHTDLLGLQMKSSITVATASL